MSKRVRQKKGLLILRKSLSVASIVLLATSCKTNKQLVEKKVSLQHESSKLLLNNLKKNEFNYDWLSAKVNVDISVDSSSNSFNISLRAKKDSVIWMSISPALGIEVARVIITKDSVKFMDRIHHTYFKGDYNYIDNLLQTELDFDMLQSMMVGNSVAFYEDETKLKSSVSKNENYVLSTIRKRKVRRVLEKNKDLKDPAEIIFLEPIIYKISRIVIKDFDMNRTFDANFNDFEKQDSLLFPRKANFDIKAEKHITISLYYSRVNTNEKNMDVPFFIPQKYEQIDYKKN
ncbi:MAG TPA: DUF4292 domain-containing protein [Bacteroidia bacterium]|nr:DUF4292 domain-containing protein [Bacteroidia bacterium]